MVEHSARSQSIHDQRVQLDYETDTTINFPFKHSDTRIKSYQIFNTADAQLRKRLSRFIENVFDSSGGVSLNFSNTNLTANGDRRHNWHLKNLMIDSVSNFSISDFIGKKIITFNSTSEFLTLGDSSGQKGLKIDYSSGIVHINGSSGYSFPSSDGTAGQVLKTNGAGSISFGTGGGTVTSVTAGTGLSGGTITTTGTIDLIKVVESLGGTNQSTYAQGDIIYSSSTNTLSKLPIGSAGYVLTSTGAIPVWQSTVGSVSTIIGNARTTGVTNSLASLTPFTVGITDATFWVSANVLITTSTLFSFTVTCSYTSEDNTARVQTLPFTNLAGTPLTVIANGAGAVPTEGLPIHIRCKAGTTITIASTGTFTGVVYNIEERIVQQ